MIFKRKLVKFNNGRYGIRSYWFFGWFFVDLVTNGFNWAPGSMFFSDCQGSREKVESILNRGKIKYELVE